MPIPRFPRHMHPAQRALTERLPSLPLRASLAGG